MAGLSFNFTGPAVPPDYAFLAMALPCAGSTDGSVPADPCAIPSPTEAAYGDLYPRFAAGVGSPAPAPPVDYPEVVLPEAAAGGSSCCVLAPEPNPVDTPPAAVSLPAAWPMAIVAIAALAAAGRKPKQRR